MTAGIDSTSRVAANVVGLGGRTHLLQALLGALAGLLRDVGVVNGGLETSSDQVTSGQPGVGVVIESVNELVAYEL